MVAENVEQICQAEIVVDCHQRFGFIVNACFVNDNNVTQEGIITVHIILQAFPCDVGSGRDYLGVVLLLPAWRRGAFSSHFLEPISHERSFLLESGES